MRYVVNDTASSSASVVDFEFETDDETPNDLDLRCKTTANSHIDKHDSTTTATFSPGTTSCR